MEHRRVSSILGEWRALLRELEAAPDGLIQDDIEGRIEAVRAEYAAAVADALAHESDVVGHQLEQPDEPDA